MRLASLLRSAAVMAGLAFAAPLSAQDFTFNDIAWGIDPQATTDALAPLGFVLNTEFTPDQGEVMYEGEDHAVLLASFAGAALVGIRVAYAGAREQVDEYFERSVQEGMENLGEPDELGKDMVIWRSGETLFSFLRGESQNGLVFLAVQYGGPGYEKEIARRLGQGGGRP